MSLRHLLRQPVTIEHREFSAHDTYGSEEQRTGSTTDTLGHLEVWREKEEMVRADTLEAIWRVMLPPDVDIDTTDRILVQGRRFEVIDVRPVMHPRHNVLHHWFVRCTETIG